MRQFGICTNAIYKNIDKVLLIQTLLFRICNLFVDVCVKIAPEKFTGRTEIKETEILVFSDS